MSKTSVILGLALVLFAFIGAYMVAFFVIYDSPGSDSDPPSDDEPDIEYEGNLDKNEVISEALRLANEERKERDIDGLGQSMVLQDIAEYKAEKMTAQQYISHTSPSGETVEDRFDRFNMDCESYGENLAQTYYKSKIDANYGSFDTYTTEQELAEGIVKQFMASDSHKENLLSDDWETMAIGIGINDEGRVYVAQEFCGEQTE